MIGGPASESSPNARLEAKAVMHSATSGQSLSQSGTAGGLSGHGMPSAICIGMGAAIDGSVMKGANDPSRSPRTAKNASSRPMGGSRIIMESLP